MRVALLAGGPSSEHDVSLQTSREMLAQLRRGGHDVRPVFISRHDTWHVGDASSDFDELTSRPGLDADQAVEDLHDRGEVALLGLHGRFGEDGTVQRLLAAGGVPYTGSDARASALCMDKDLTKQAAAELGARLAAHVVVSDEASLFRARQSVPAPWVVKPVCGGSSVATSRVAESHELPAAVAAARAEDADDRALVEALVSGGEITATVLRLEGVVRCLPLVAIEPSSQDAFYTYHAKYESEATRFTCPAPLPDATRAEVERLALALYDKLGLRGVVRLDFIDPEDGGAPVFLEVNTLPGFTSHSLVPMAAESAGMTRLAVLESLLRDAAT